MNAKAWGAKGQPLICALTSPISQLLAWHLPLGPPAWKPPSATWLDEDPHS